MFNIDIKFKNPKSSEFKNEIIILVDRIKIDEKKLIENINLNAINEKYQKLEQEKEKDKSQQNTDAENNANDPFKERINNIYKKNRPRENTQFNPSRLRKR